MAKTETSAVVSRVARAPSTGRSARGRTERRGTVRGLLATPAATGPVVGTAGAATTLAPFGRREV